MLQSSELREKHAFMQGDEAQKYFDEVAEKFHNKDEKTLGEFVYVIRDVAIHKERLPIIVEITYVAIRMA